MTHHESFLHCLLVSGEALALLTAFAMAIGLVIMLCDWLGDKIPERARVPLQVTSVIGFVWLTIAFFCFMEAQK